MLITIITSIYFNRNTLVCTEYTIFFFAPNRYKRSLREATTTTTTPHNEHKSRQMCNTSVWCLAGLERAIAIGMIFRAFFFLQSVWIKNILVSNAHNFRLLRHYKSVRNWLFDVLRARFWYLGDFIGVQYGCFEMWAFFSFLEF